jgi:ComEC/Rec2-related protein
MKHSKKYLFFLVMTFTASFLLRLHADSGRRIQKGEKLRVTAAVKNQPRPKNGRVYFDLGRFKAVVSQYQLTEPVYYGDYLVIEGKAEPEYVLGLYKSIWLQKVEIIEVKEETPALYQQGRLVADKMKQCLDRLFPKPHSSLLGGVLLGIDSGFSESFYHSLQKTGTLHLVVASGGNLAFVVSGVMYFLYQGLNLNRKKALAAAVFLVLVYVYIVGFEPPVVRAGIMSVLSLAAAVLGRQKDGWWFLFLSCWMMLLVNPLLLFNVSFQLSVGSTAGLLLLGPKHKPEEGSWKKVFTNLKGELQTAVAAFVFTAPVIWFHFEEISLLGIIVNPMVNWIIPYLMILGTIVLVLGLCWLPLGWIAQPFCYLLLDFFVQVVGFFGQG